ncbi:Otopetrin-2, partial [Stegodyphus mimosarum]
MCLLNSTVGSISEKATKFLYPFASQYCFIIVCVLYVLWEESRPDTKKCSFTSYVPYDRDNNGICNRSTKGLFCGFLILVSSIIITVMFLTSKNVNYIVLRSIYCIIFTLSFCASILGLTQVKRMSVSKCNCRTRFIKLFQASGIISVYIYGSCNIIVGALSDDTISLLISCEAVLMMLHASTQYVFIFEVSGKRIDNSNMYVKPGRQIVFFLAFCNVSLWLLDSFILWNHAKSDLQVKFYGNIAWPVIMRLVIPFLVYFRFYSATVLLQAWIISY